MPENRLNLSVLCGLETDASGLPIRVGDRDKLLKSIHDAMTRSHLGVYNLDQRLLKFVGESLRKPIADILGEAWRQRKELREIAEQGDDGRDVEGEVELYDHSIKFALHPSVQLRANGEEICTLKFDVETDLKLQALKLEMRNACITQIKAGKLKSTTELKFKDLPLMAPCEKTIDLPLSMDLPGEGIPLRLGLNARAMSA